MGMEMSAQDGMDRSAREVIDDMSPGWNLGNTLEAVATWRGVDFLNNKSGLGGETDWQGTKTTQEVIDYVKSLGFRSIRIPCAWAYGHISNAATYEIDATWMATIAKNKEVLTALWTQIATVFKDYDEHLLFAGLNEPNAENQAATNNLIQYNQTFVDAVRATGGNNGKRVLVVQGPSTNIEYTCKFMTGKMPTDVVEGKLAIEVHYYNPWNFWGMEKDESWGNVFYYWGKGNHLSGSKHNPTYGEESDMKKQLQMMKTNFVDMGYPVVIGEFGANWRDLSSLPKESQEKHNASIKTHYRELHRLCKDLGGMVPMAWDTNFLSQEGTKGCMTIVDRTNLKVFGTYAMDGINEVYPRPSESSLNPKVVPSRQQEGTFYTLQGMRTEGEPTAKGIYIVQGRKLVR